MSRHQTISDALELIFRGIERLNRAFPNRAFTIDGRLVGDIGEIIASLEYDIVLHDIAQPKHDAVLSDGRGVQIKATFRDQLTFRTIPDLYLGFKLQKNGDFEEIFNGPGEIIYQRHRHRKGIGVGLLSFPVSELRDLSKSVSPADRIPKRQ